MYAWIWRHLPFGLAGKIVGSLLLAAAFGALLWFQIFPMVEEYLPVNDGQITQSDDPSGDLVSPSAPASRSGSPHG
jgi:hypothetical protein